MKYTDLTNEDWALIRLAIRAIAQDNDVYKEIVTGWTEDIQDSVDIHVTQNAFDELDDTLGKIEEFEYCLDKTWSEAGPCPRCGGRCSVDGTSILCDVCGLMSPSFNTIEEAIEYWNTATC